MLYYDEEIEIKLLSSPRVRRIQISLHLLFTCNPHRSLSDEMSAKMFVFNWIHLKILSSTTLLG